MCNLRYSIGPLVVESDVNVSVDPDAMPHPVACRIFVEIRTVLFFE